MADNGFPGKYLTVLLAVFFSDGTPRCPVCLIERQFDCPASLESNKLGSSAGEQLWVRRVCVSVSSRTLPRSRSLEIKGPLYLSVRPTRHSRQYEQEEKRFFFWRALSAMLLVKEIGTDLILKIFDGKVGETGKGAVDFPVNPSEMYESNSTTSGSYLSMDWCNTRRPIAQTNRAGTLSVNPVIYPKVYSHSFVDHEIQTPQRTMSPERGTQRAIQPRWC